MGSNLIYAVNCAFSWIIVALSVAGYFVTLRRAHEKWPLWILLGVGWAFLALPNTLLLTGASMARSQLVGMWLSSFVLVAASLSLLFLKLIDIKKRRSMQQTDVDSK